MRKQQVLTPKHYPTKSFCENRFNFGSPQNFGHPSIKLNFDNVWEEMKPTLGKRARVESLDDSEIILNLDADSSVSSVGKRFKPEPAALS